MVNLQELKQHTNELVELSFEDGHIVRARLISVDLYEPEEIIYDVQEIVAAGPRELATVTPGTVAAADPRLLMGFRVVD